MELMWENSVWAIIAFSLLIYFLRKYAFGPLLDVMEKRREFVQKQLDEAANSRVQAQSYVEEQKQALATARKDAYDIVEQAKQTSIRQADEIIGDAKSEAVRLKEEAVRDIEREKNKAITALHSEVGSLSVAIASKILKKQVDENEQLISQYLKEVGGKL